jgi:hypothetical protein
VRSRVAAYLAARTKTDASVSPIRLKDLEFVTNTGSRRDRPDDRAQRRN